MTPEHITGSDEILSLKARWLAVFADGIKVDDYLWHIFSFKRRACAEKMKRI
jgi:hypothetical protein